MYNESDCIFGEVMKKNIICILTICSACLSLLYARGNKAEIFPRKDREITIICPQPEGGGTDAIIRALTEELNKDKAAHFTVKNISGRGTSDGTDYVLSLPADGYTILVGGTHTITATMQGKTDGYKKLETIAGLNEDPFVIGVKKKRDVCFIRKPHKKSEKRKRCSHRTFRNRKRDACVMHRSQHSVRSYIYASAVCRGCRYS
jgi:tripartite-type tricarboxylate transporter receptor subunit TctC